MAQADRASCGGAVDFFLGGADNHIVRRAAVVTAAALLAAGSAVGCGANKEPARAVAAPTVAATSSPGSPTAAATRPPGRGGCTRAAATTSAASGRISAGPFLADQTDAVRYGQAKLWVKLDPPPPGNPGATVRVEPLDPPGRVSVQVRRQLGFLGGPGEDPFYPGAIPVRQHGLYKITVLRVGRRHPARLRPAPVSGAAPGASNARRDTPTCRTCAVG